MPEADFAAPGVSIIDSQGFPRGVLLPVTAFGSFWHYIVRVPVGLLGGGPSEKLVEASIEWSHKRLWYITSGDDYSKVLRIIVSP